MSVRVGIEYFVTERGKLAVFVNIRHRAYAVYFILDPHAEPTFTAVQLRDRRHVQSHFRAAAYYIEPYSTAEVTAEIVGVVHNITVYFFDNIALLQSVRKYRSVFRLDARNVFYQQSAHVYRYPYRKAADVRIRRSFGVGVRACEQLRRERRRKQ